MKTFNLRSKRMRRTTTTSPNSVRRVERYILKYFNLLLCIIMLVAFSLNLEQFLHNRHIFQPDNYNVFKIISSSSLPLSLEPNETAYSETISRDNLLKYPSLLACRQCQENALIMLNQLNSKSIKTNQI